MSETVAGAAPMRVLLAGASGTIGGAVASQLIADGHHVTAVGRNAKPLPPNCSVLVADITLEDDLIRVLQGETFDVVISCIASRTGVAADAWRVDYQANRFLLNAALSSGVRRFVLLSAICVQRPRLEFQRAKLKFEAELRNADLEHCIIRPTAFFKSLSGQIKRVCDGKAFLVFGDGQLTRCQPIGTVDLAKFIVLCMTRPDARNATLPIGGPGPAITPLQQGQLLFQLTGKKAKFRHVPVQLFSIAAFILSPLAKFSSRFAAKAELARIGAYYATESMLLWDDQSQSYDEDGTPSTGSETLRDHYQRLLAEDDSNKRDDQLGAHKLF